MSDDIMDVPPIARKLGVVFFLIDASENMVGEKIEAINKTMPEIISMIKDMADDYVDIETKIATLRFGGDASWETPLPVGLEEYKYQNISAGGEAVMGKAFFELASKLDKKAFLSTPVGVHIPIMILLSDGKPCDDYNAGLEALRNNKYFSLGIRIAFAIGKDANMDFLAEFTGNRELVIESNNMGFLKRSIRYINIDSYDGPLLTRKEELIQQIRDEIKEEIIEKLVERVKKEVEEEILERLLYELRRDKKKDNSTSFSDSILLDDGGW